MSSSQDNQSPCKHTTGPEGYAQWHEWAERMSKRYDQHQCPKCGLWSIWKLKATGKAPDTDDDYTTDTEILMDLAYISEEKGFDMDEVLKANDALDRIWEAEIARRAKAPDQAITRLVVTLPNSESTKELEAQMDDLIMRLKDCISHEDGHEFGSRCITRVQFKKQMKALITEQKIAELEGIKALSPDNAVDNFVLGQIDRRIAELKSKQGYDQ